MGLEEYKVRDCVLAAKGDGCVDPLALTSMVQSSLVQSSSPLNGQAKFKWWLVTFLY